MRTNQRSRAWMVLLLCAAPILGNTGLAHAGGGRVTLTQTNAPPLSLLGYGTREHDSAQFDEWYDYSGANFARLWSSPGKVQKHPSAFQIITRANFIQWRIDLTAELKAHPEYFQNGTATTQVNWGAIQAAYLASELETALQGMDDTGIVPLTITDSRSGTDLPISGTPYLVDPNQTGDEYWWDRWYFWRHYFIQAYYLAREHEVVHFEVVNEPELEPFDKHELYERVTLAGDAIQHAFDAVNVWRASQSKPALKPNILVGAFVHGVLDNPAADMRPYVVDKRIQSSFFGSSLADAQAVSTLFQSYSYHSYGTSNPTSEVLSVRASLNAKTLPAVLPVYITELNTSTGGSASDAGWGLMRQDTVRNAMAMARKLVAFSQSGVTGAIIHKFGLDEGAQHGLFWISDQKVGGATRSAEVARLYAEGFSGARTRYQFTGTSDATHDPYDTANEFTIETSYDAAKKHYYIFSINQHCSIAVSSTQLVCDPGEPNKQSLTLDLSAWNIAPGTQVMVEEVSLGRRAEVRRYYVVDSARKILLEQPAQSVVLFTIPSYGARNPVLVQATADATVRAGNNRGNNYGTSDSLTVRANPTSADGRFASLIKMTLPAGFPASAVDMAVLKVTARSGTNETTGSGSAVVHVYGIDDDGWSESDVRWNVTPNLGRETATLGAVDSVASNFLWDVGISAHILGSITGNSNEPYPERIDVTDYVRAQTDGVATFLVMREVRFDAFDNGTPSQATPSDTSATDSGLWMASRQHANADYRPVLELVRR